MNKDEAIRVLIIEDHPYVADTMARVIRLSSERVTEVVISGTLAEGMAMIRQTAFALVVLDLNLPDSEPMDTIAMAPEMKKLGVPRIVGVTALMEYEAVSTIALAHGFDDLLAKRNLDPGGVENDPRFFLHRLKSLFANGRAK